MTCRQFVCLLNPRLYLSLVSLGVLFFFFFSLAENAQLLDFQYGDHESGFMFQMARNGLLTDWVKKKSQSKLY